MSVIALPFYNSQELNICFENAKLLSVLPEYKPLFKNEDHDVRTFINYYMVIVKKCFLNPNRQYTIDEVNAFNRFDLINILSFVLEAINKKKQTLFPFRDDRLTLVNDICQAFRINDVNTKYIYKKLFSNKYNDIYELTVFLINKLKLN
jgi:hypothetical protein